MATVDASVWVAVISLGVSIIGGAIIMAWRLGGLNTSVKLLEKSLDGNTKRLDVIEAKADGAKDTATAATSAVAVLSSSIQRRRDDADWSGFERRGRE